MAAILVGPPIRWLHVCWRVATADRGVALAWLFVAIREFVYDVVVKQLLGLPLFQNLLLIVYDHINTICAIIQRLFRQKNSGNSV